MSILHSVGHENKVKRICIENSSWMCTNYIWGRIVNSRHKYGSMNVIEQVMDYEVFQLEYLFEVLSVSFLINAFNANKLIMVIIVYLLIKKAENKKEWYQHSNIVWYS